MANNNWEIKAAGFVSGLQPVVEQWANRKREANEVGEFTSKIKRFYENLKTKATVEGDPWAIQTLDWFESDPGMMSLASDDNKTYRQVQAALSLPKAPQKSAPKYEYIRTEEFHPDDPELYRNTIEVMSDGKRVGSYPVSGWGKKGGGVNVNVGDGAEGSVNEAMTAMQKAIDMIWSSHVGKEIAQVIGIDEARAALETYEQWKYLKNLQHLSPEQKEYLKNLESKDGPMEYYFGKKVGALGWDWLEKDKPSEGKMSLIGGAPKLRELFYGGGNAASINDVAKNMTGVYSQFKAYKGVNLEGILRKYGSVYDPAAMWEKRDTEIEQDGVEIIEMTPVR